MANDIPDLSTADFSDVKDWMQKSGAAIAGVNANANPDEAARAAQLGAATGIPSNVIHLDPKAFEAQLRQRVTQGIVGGNESLAHYAGSDPMASIVSNDDWAHLDTLSGMLHGLRQATDIMTQPIKAMVSGALKGGAEGFEEGIGIEPLSSIGDMAKQLKPKELGDWPSVVAAALASNIGESVLRVGSGIMGGLSGAAGGAAQGLTGSEQLGRDVKGLTEYKMIKPEQMPGGPWLMAGHEPPAGISKELDKAKVERNETLLKGLEDATTLVQQSKTWERSPELFKKFVEQHLGERSISISGDAVRTLYGDTPPAPNDGKLGWVPDIGNKLLAAAVDGSDVEVPLSDWLTHMDPAVAKGLHDNIRMWPEGVTKAESGVERQPVPPPPTPDAVNQVRAAGGLEPVFRVGPEPAPTEAAPTASAVEPENPRIARLKDEVSQFELSIQRKEARLRDAEETFKSAVQKQQGDRTPIETFMASIAKDREHIKELQDKIEKLKPTTAAEKAQATLEGLPGVAKPQSVGAARSDHPMIIGLNTIDPKAVGLPEGHWQKLQELAQAQYEDDMSLAQRKAERQAKQRETAEWKANRAEIAKEVEAEVRAMPHVAADLFIGAGELEGQKIQQRFTLREEDLNDAQKAALPAHYISKNGLPIDDVAAHFGFGSGDALVDALASHHLLKGGRSPGEMLREMVKLETDRRMEQKYGDLPSNILTAAHDQALSETTLNLVTQEYQGAAMSAKVEYLQDAQIKEEAKRIADSVINKDVDSRKKLAEVSRHYSDAVKGLLGNDPQSAVLALQRRAIGAHVAKELMAREEAMEKFAKIADRYARRWDPTKAEGQKIAPEWSLFIRNILGKVGLKTGMTRAWMDQEITNSRFTGLADFVTKVEKESSLVDLHLPIPDFLYEPKVKPLKEMTGDEFRATADTVTLMDHLGREDQKIDVAGQKFTKDGWISKAVAQLKRKFDPLPSDRKVGPAGALAAASTNAETVFSRFDGRDPHGLFTETFIYPTAEGSNFKNRVEREESKKYLDLGKIRDEKKLIDSPIIDPSTGKPWANFTRKELHAIISNMGNEYNWKIACKGWGVDPDLMWKWVEAHTDVNDIMRAQGLGNQFSGLKPRIDVVDRNVYGVASESVIPRPFTMHGQQFDGWYHPVIGDPVLNRYINKMPDLDKEPTNFWPSVYNKFLVKRTGAVQFIALNYDAIPSRLMQQIHYLAMHEPVMDAAKLIRDQRFRDGVIRHYGKEYMEVIDHWLQSAAGDGSYNSGMMASANKWSGILRQNVVNTQIAFNLGTVLKHGPTAFAYSLRELAPKTVVAGIPSFAHVTAEVAPGLFKHAVMDLFGKSPTLGDSWFDFVRQHSEEIQRRERNYQDTMMGAHQMFDQGWSLRNTVSLYGAKMVAFSDMLSAAPLWLARYRQEIAKNPDDMGAAIRAADFSVRRAHGSTAVTSRPMIATGSNPVTPWLTSLYGFMGTSLNRRIEIMHDMNDFYKLGRKGEITEAAKMLPPILSGLAVYVVWTGLVEEHVTGQFTDDHRGVLAKSASFLFGSVANAIIGLRDVAWNLDRGGDSAGMISTPINDVVKLFRDLHMEKAVEGHYNPLAKQNAGRLIQDTCTVIGDLKGYCPKHVGTMLRYGHDAFEGVQRPRSGDDWYRGMITGSQKLYERR